MTNVLSSWVRHFAIISLWFESHVKLVVPCSRRVTLSARFSYRLLRKELMIVPGLYLYTYTHTCPKIRVLLARLHQRGVEQYSYKTKTIQGSTTFQVSNLPKTPVWFWLKWKHAPYQTLGCHKETLHNIHQKKLAFGIKTQWYLNFQGLGLEVLKWIILLSPTQLVHCFLLIFQC